MGVSSSLQFVGKEQVLQAYRNRGVDAWSLWQGKQFLTKGIDETDLDVFLSSIWKGSTATFTLKVYEDIRDPKQIKEKTECDGSFNFRLVDREDDYVPGTGKGRLEEKITGLENRFDLFLEKFNEPVEDKEPETIGSIVMGILSDPDKLEKTIGVVHKLFGDRSQIPAQIGNVNVLDSNESLSPSLKTPMSGTNKKTLTESELTRLYNAVETLTNSDEQIVSHMEKLASIAIKNPGQFKVLLTMLESFS